MMIAKITIKITALMMLLVMAVVVMMMMMMTVTSVTRDLQT
jgi:hypothetical protein